MDIIFLIFTGFYVSKRAKEKGLNPSTWVWRLIGVCVLFELAGALFSMAVNGSLIMAGIFGFFCVIGGFLLIKYRLDKMPDKTNTGHWTDNFDNS